MRRRDLEALPRDEVERRGRALGLGEDIIALPTAALAAAILIAVGEVADVDMTLAVLSRRISDLADVVESHRERHGKILLRLERAVESATAVAEVAVFQHALDASVWPPLPRDLALLSDDALSLLAEKLTYAKDISMGVERRHETKLGETRQVRGEYRATLLNRIADMLGWTPWIVKEEE